MGSEAFFFRTDDSLAKFVLPQLTFHGVHSVISLIQSLHRYEQKRKQASCTDINHSIDYVSSLTMSPLGVKGVNHCPD